MEIDDLPIGPLASAYDVPCLDIVAQFAERLEPALLRTCNPFCFETKGDGGIS
jgi:hypothetical protein